VIVEVILVGNEIHEVEMCSILAVTELRSGCDERLDRLPACTRSCGFASSGNVSPRYFENATSAPGIRSKAAKTNALALDDDLVATTRSA
jgi:hypothetical protein